MKVLMTLELPAKLENLERWVKSISDCAESQGFDRKRISGIELAAEEAFVNICNYSYPGKPGDVEVICELDGNRFIIEIIDSGIPFDMTSLPDPDITADVDDRKIGGLGILLIKKMVDEVRYRRENNRNILNLIIEKDK
jgi:serine/threonine-protein kinase RsbW